MESFEELSHLSARKRAVFGLRAGVRLGAYFALAAAAIGLFLGRVEGQGPPAILLGVGVFLGFLLAGLIFGLLRPRVRNTPGAALLGAACLAPILFAGLLAMRGLAALRWSTGVAGLGIALLVGSLLGSMAWNGWTRTASH